MRNQAGLVFYFLFWLIYFFSENAFSATALPPASTEPALISKQISATRPRAKVRHPAAISQLPQAQVLAPEILAIQLQIKGFVFEGNTLYPDNELLELFPHRMNTTVTLGDIQQFVEAITLKYNNNGYVLSQALLPPQHIKGGIVHIRVIEGYVDKVTVEGNINAKTKAVLLSYATKATQHRPLQIRELERSLLLINDIPGIDLQSVLSPSKTKLGAADLVILAVKQNFDGYIDYDNRGTRYIGPTRVIASAAVNYMLGGGAMTAIRGAESGGLKELRYLEIEHKQLIGTSGLYVDLDGQLTHTEPEFLLNGTDTIGRSKVLLLTMQYPIIRQHDKSFFINGGFSYINSNMMELFTKLYNDQIRSFQLGAIYNFNDSHRGINQLNGTFTQGTRLLGASGTSNIVSRYLAVPTFTKINANASRLQGLIGSFSLMLSATSQYSFNRLYAYEQFTYGGLPFGNAYDPAEIIGDKGFAAKAELRYDAAYKPFKLNLPVQYFVYYDGGMIWNYDAINQAGRQTGTSSGFGLRSSIADHFNVSLELDKPLDRKVAAVAVTPNGGNPKAWRGFFSLSLND